jgi:hypothetical protein
MSGEGWALAATALLAAAGVAAQRRRVAGSLSPHAPCIKCGSRAGTPEDFVLYLEAGAHVDWSNIKKIPRALRRRRFAGLYSVGVPLSKAKNRWPLAAPHPDMISILDFLDTPALDLSSRQPRLILSEPVFSTSGGYTTKYRGKVKKYPLKSRVSESVSFFSKTKKMAAPSFSLPAGPPTLGGTCIAASYVPGKGVVNEKGEFICAHCYAVKGHYIQHNVAFSQAVRLRWVIAQLQVDPSGQLLTEGLVNAMGALARTSTMSHAASRCDQELGVWERGRIMVPSTCGTASTVAAGTKLPAPWGSTEQVIAGLDPREGQIAGFFRWHDSGDVNVGTKPKLWLGYVRAIRNVAKAFPAVLFWLPTRTFEIEPMRKALVNAAQDAPNLTIRPSAYMTCDPPPVVPGLAAGTAVLEIEKKKPLPTTVDDLGRRAWACPVYTTKGADNCLDAGCRTCWIRPDVPVWYAFH